MSRKPPSKELISLAAELRAGGSTWEAVARQVHRALRTVVMWPRKYPERWTAALLQAERQMTAQSDSESVLILRKLLLSPDEKVRWHAAKCLIARRLDRAKIELKTPPAAHPHLSPEALRLLYLMDGQSDDELRDIVACLPRLPAPPAG